MKTSPAPTSDDIPSSFIEEVCATLASDERVRRKLPGGGLLNIDRLLPFLLVYRRNPQRRDAGTQSFIDSEASYLTAPGDAPVRKGLTRLVRRIAETTSARLGAFFIIEIWSAPDESLPAIRNEQTGELILPSPYFRIHERAPKRPGPSVNDLIFALEQIHVHRQPAKVDVVLKGIAHPPGSHQLIENKEGLKINCFVVGLEILPIYRDPATGDVFPDVLRQLHLGVCRALRKSFFRFSLQRTNVRPQHYFALGRRRLSKLVWEVDHQLAEIGAKYSFLLQVTPINAETAWQEFEASGFEREPVFNYRPQVADPLLLKRQVIDVPTERIVDATMAHLLRQTQDELDRMATMLADIGTARFLPGSLQVFGGVEPSLLALAEEMLVRLRNGRKNNREGEPQVSAKAFAKRATKEIQAYRRQHADFAAQAEVREDMYSGLMVSGGNLLIGRETSLPSHRVNALMAHEVGTHLVTFYNGKAQPLRLLSTGLAGYDALQEGLAVLSEFLVGGLTRGRLRMLAARVVAVHRLIAGAPFRETFALLSEEHGFEQRSAYTITMRVYRGGGLTKDAVYLRGLVEILEYLRCAGDLSMLFVGKLAVDHVPIVRELLLREVLHAPPLTPHYMSEPSVAKKLAALKKGLTVLQLVEC